MIRYICPECGQGGAHPENLPAPLCHRCSFQVRMVKVLDKSSAKAPMLDLSNRLSTSTPIETWEDRLNHSGKRECEALAIECMQAEIDERRAQAEQGEVVVTKNEAGQIVCVTRQDDEGRILKVISESSVEPFHYAAMYVTLRNMHWADGHLTVIKAKDAPLGTQTYSGEMLDDAIRAVQANKKEGV